MNRLLLLPAATLCLLATPTMAQEFQGHWFGQGEGEITLDLTHIDGDTYDLSLNTVVPISDQGGGCAGGVDGQVDLTSEGGLITIENEDFDPNADITGHNSEFCEVSLSFNEDGTLNVQEESGCLYHHGAACGFSGTLEHDAAGI